MAKLKAKDIQVNYQNRTKVLTALSGINITFDPQEITCIVGSSGAGKSTLIKALAGAVPIDEGAVSLNDDTLSKAKEDRKSQFSISKRRARRRIAWIAQESKMVLNATALENTCHGFLSEVGILNTFVTGFPKALLNKAYMLLKKLQIEDKVHEKLKKLSGGQRQRVAIARGMCQKADWILADEPFSALDEAMKDVAWKCLLEKKQEGTGLILILHDLNMALKVSDRIICLRHGNVIYDGKPDGFYETTRLQLFNTNEIKHAG